MRYVRSPPPSLQGGVSDGWEKKSLAEERITLVTAPVQWTNKDCGQRKSAHVRKRNMDQPQEGKRGEAQGENRGNNLARHWKKRKKSDLAAVHSQEPELGRKGRYLPAVTSSKYQDRPKVQNVNRPPPRFSVRLHERSRKTGAWQKRKEVQTVASKEDKNVKTQGGSRRGLQRPGQW